MTFCSGHSSSHCLSDRQQSSPVKRVAIAGAGIAGLTCALSLVRNTGVLPSNVEIFEPRASLDVGLGAGLNLNNACALLYKEYGVRVSEFGMPVIRGKSQFVNNGPVVFDIGFLKAFRELQSPKAVYMLDGETSQPLLATVAREDLQRVLAEKVVEEGIVIHRGVSAGKVVGLEEHISPEGCREVWLYVSGGHRKAGPFNLVIGADGVHSTIRKYVAPCPSSITPTFYNSIPFFNKPACVPCSSEKKLTPSTYSGVKACFAVITRSRLRAHEQSPFGELRQHLCNDGIVIVRYPLNEIDEMMAVLYAHPSPAEENVAYSHEHVIRRRTMSKMSKAGAPVEAIAAFSSGHRFIETGIYQHELPPRWSRGLVVLIGDAAHAMAPFMGQGANQAIQDAHILSLQLGLVGSCHDTVEDALNAFEQAVRKDVQVIMRKSKILGKVLTMSGCFGSILRKLILLIAGKTGLLQRDIVSAFLPRLTPP